MAALATLGLSRSALASVSSTAALARSGDARTYPIPAADGVTIDRDSQVILVRSANTVFAFALSCPHQNTALRWNEHDHRFQCPKHKSKYQPDGTFISGRATRAMDRYAIKRDGANVVIDLATVYEQDKDAAGWGAAAIHLQG